ncbi:molybdopterin-dependent oxidoreductase [Thermomonas sp. HDW16]|uniref:molybdopterin-dependent oxidoreductase n=1 Tax=Thermomonas sp. HDW16 TaxID=2714945 RepID=UPI001408EF8A|nr:molybdopterin-dependent oxidoreductase [Thermomonas sp. HDW16]QIL20309.1 molybdopterin-dependent oxidoreductase [Thermomonas sp. HDW16]
MKSRSLLLALLLLPAIGLAQSDHADVGTPSHAVRVSGAVTAPREFDLAAIKQLAGRDSGPVDVVCASGATVGKADNYRGVRLREVIDATGLALEGHKDARRMVVVARATDGYLVTFSWNELYNTPIGDEVLVAWEKDGAALTPREGQLLLISGKDIKTGPRHVRQLSEIEIVRMK